MFNNCINPFVPLKSLQNSTEIRTNTSNIPRPLLPQKNKTETVQSGFAREMVPSTSLHSFLVGSWALSRSLHYSRGGASGMSARACVYLVCTCAYVWCLMRRESAFGRCLSAGSSSFDGHATFVPCLYYTESATEACEKARSWCTCSENWTCK